MKKLFSLALIATSVALLSAVLLPAMASAADAPATFTPEQEAKIGKIAADYLVAHPEVLLQASQKLQQIQAEQQASAATQAVLKNAAVLTQDKNTPTYGPANGKVTVTLSAAPSNPLLVIITSIAL